MSERSEMTREKQSNGGKARAANLNVQRRHQIATVAVYIREARKYGWNPYSRDNNDLGRIGERLLKLEAIEAKAWAEGNDDRVIRCIMAAVPWERLKMMLTSQKSLQMLDMVEVQPETQVRLEEARKRRQRAMEEPAPAASPEERPVEKIIDKEKEGK